MKKRWLTAFLISCVTLSASSQTLFTYGNNKADAKEFLRAFNKNNQQPATARAKAMQEYLELYINSRLKIREAYDRGYDSLPQIMSEVDVLRNQIIENYMSEPETVDRMSKEAFQRSQKDIHAAHIFISFTDAAGTVDTTAARTRLNEVLNRLAKGVEFGTVAQELSEDPSAKSNKGDLGLITAFTLPYEFETLLYSTPTGKYSRVYSSKTGFHILKNISERKAFGKIKIQQILLAFPPGMDEAGKKSYSKLADSLYQRLIKGDDFGKLAAKYSTDYISAAADGNIPDISVGQYDSQFENVIWGLKDRTVSKPFLSSHGYHIVKRISAQPIPASTDKKYMEELKQKVMADERWKTAKDFIYERVRTKAGYEKYAFPDAALWALSDSLLDYKPVGIGKSMTVQSPLLRIGDTTLRVANWIEYAQLNRYKPDRTGMKPYPDLMDEFSKSMMYQYYRTHLEDFNDDFRIQMSEFRDGNLFFEIMQQEVWNKAQADSVALLALYDKNKHQYQWQQSADAVIFFCTDEASAKTLLGKLKTNPANWKAAVEPLNEKVVADSARYEWGQLPGVGKLAPKQNSLTPLAINPTDHTTSFAYIIKVYTKPSPRSFNEAKGLVMNDYQTQLEEAWIKDLKKKYPVVVDQQVLASIEK